MPTETLTLTDRVRVNGSTAEASLLEEGGMLTWMAEGEPGERSLNLESEVLGFGVEEGRRVRVRAFVDDSKAASCGSRKSIGKRVRKDFLLEMPTEELAAIWSERLKNCMISFGRLLISSSSDDFGGKDTSFGDFFIRYR